MITSASSRSNDERAEPEPQRPVGGGERDHRVDQPDRREAVEHAGDDVERRAARSPAATRRDGPCRSRTAASAARGEAQRCRACRARRSTVSSTQRDRAGAAGQVPVGARPDGCEHARSRGHLVRRARPRRRSSPSAGQPATWRDAAPSSRDEPARQAQRREPAERALAADDRGRAGDVGVQAGGGGDADRAPDGARPAGPVAGSTQVVDGRARRRPAADGRARGGQAAGAERDPLAGASTPVR